ncbi:DUF368 domain-containing protein [Aureispira anguillae]|uniref:DUF368 domain-containing protein n=1 Tax=Aureispira anguillae TaxID=2864201 RepID=A0A915YJ20_9BACT|nr:DUF368 domain-containing protein [Aureispira anguillae]BDS14117.1 DUF368 domain-containing protein [Aureispira anguillae]
MSNNEPILDGNSSVEKPTNSIEYIFIFLRGLAMGAADVVPGVSGGTIAFITGIYERLLNAIKSVNPTAIRLLFKEGFNAAWKHIDGTFLVALFAGIFVSLFTLSKGLKWCLANYPQLLWAFFFGLIIASSIYIIKQVERWNPSAIVGLILGGIVAYIITIVAPTEAPTAYWMVFLAGAIAISAMILPGISGSFILLLMGMYRHVLNAATEMDIVFLLIFMAGCIVGLLSFSHLLSWTFKNYKNTTLAVLAGFMIGSLNKVWPWQNVARTRIDSHGNEVPWLMENVMPSNYLGETYILWCLILLIVGFSIVFLLERLGNNMTKE